MGQLKNIKLHIVTDIKIEGIQRTHISKVRRRSCSEYRLKMLNLLITIFGTAVIGILLVCYFFLNADIDKPTQQKIKSKQERHESHQQQQKQKQPIEKKSRQNVEDDGLLKEYSSNNNRYMMTGDTKEGE